MPSITFSVKLDSERDAELVAWLQDPGINRSYEIKSALYHYRNMPPPPSDPGITPPPFNPDMLIAALREVAPDLGAAIGGAIITYFQENTLATYTNQQPLIETPEKVKPEFKAKRPEKKNHHEPPPKPPDTNEEALAVATENFLNLFA